MYKLQRAFAVPLLMFSALFSPRAGWSEPNRSALAVPPVLVPDFMASPEPEPPLRLERVAAPSLKSDLQPAVDEEVERLEEMRAWNRSPENGVAQIGLVRYLPSPRRVSLRGAVSDKGRLIQTSSIKVEGAFRLRLHLGDVRLPEDVKMWVYGQDEDSFKAFGLELLDQDRELWTPSVSGEIITIEVRLPSPSLGLDAEKFGFTLDRVAEEIEEVELEASGDTSCYIDSRCLPPGEDFGYKYFPKTIARLGFVGADNKVKGCTGALITNRSHSGTPYVLTAEHCIPDRKVALSVEAVWDYRPKKCGGKMPKEFPTNTGALLLEAGGETDFALLRLFSLERGRACLGWDPSVPFGYLSGLPTYRLSHPAFGTRQIPQSFSRGEIIRLGSPGSVRCTGGPDVPFRVNDPDYFIQTLRIKGWSHKGSSGSPLIRRGGYLIGQLSSVCGSGVNSYCGYTTEFSGSFYRTYDHIREFLDNAEGASVSP